MRVTSLSFDQNEWREIEIEVSLIPGLPVLHVLGLTGSVARSLQPKLKAAFMAQDFAWPKAHQVVIQVRPDGQATHSGMELAFSAGILGATGQLTAAQLDPRSIYWGEVGLEGDVRAPQDGRSLLVDKRVSQFVCGKGGSGREVQSLRDLKEIPQLILQHELPKFLSPEMKPRNFSPVAAEQLGVVALGEHPVLLAGPPGTGKTTWVESLHGLLGDPSPELWRQLWQQAELMGEEVHWRPFVAPHHSSSALAILGGGVPPRPGEITRAHGGLLFLDEYLEFNPKVQEALREPIEKGEIRLSRGPQARRYPAHFLLVAATNLCPCGRLYPERAFACSYSLTRCRSHIEKLSGPMLDRFHLVALSHEWKGLRTVSADGLAERLREARNFVRQRGQAEPNARAPLAPIEKTLSPLAAQLMPRDEGSERRHGALLRVARSFADLDLKEKIAPGHLLKAQALTQTSHHKLAHLFS